MCTGEWNPPLPPLPGNWTICNSCRQGLAPLREEEKRKQGEQCTWFWFSWRLYNGETNASSWGAQGTQNELQQGIVHHWVPARENQCVKKPEFDYFLISQDVHLRKPSIKLGQCPSVVQKYMNFCFQRVLIFLHSVIVYIKNDVLCIVSPMLYIYVNILFQGKVWPHAWGGVEFVFPSAHRRKQTVQLWV